jgi:hypothetical protein
MRDKFKRNVHPNIRFLSNTIPTRTLQWTSSSFPPNPIPIPIHTQTHAHDMIPSLHHRKGHLCLFVSVFEYGSIIRCGTIKKNISFSLLYLLAGLRIHDTVLMLGPLAAEAVWAMLTKNRVAFSTWILLAPICVHLSIVGFQSQTFRHDFVVQMKRKAEQDTIWFCAYHAKCTLCTSVYISSWYMENIYLYFKHAQIIRRTDRSQPNNYSASNIYYYPIRS